MIDSQEALQLKWKLEAEEVKRACDKKILDIEKGIQEAEHRMQEHKSTSTIVYNNKIEEFRKEQVA